MAINQRLFSKMRTALQGPDDAPEAKAIPWDTIIQAILDVLTGCFSQPASGAELKALAVTEGSEPERWLRFSVASSLREAGVRATRQNVQLAMQRVLKAKNEANEADLDELLNCCFSWDI